MNRLVSNVASCLESNIRAMNPKSNLDLQGFSTSHDMESGTSFVSDYRSALEVEMTTAIGGF